MESRDIEKEEAETCTSCGQWHYLDCSIDSAAWNQIAEDGERLCAPCIDKRLVQHGLTAVGRFYYVGKALRGDDYQRAIAHTDAEREAMREVRTRANEMKDALCAAFLIDWKDLDGDLREDAMRTVDAYKSALARMDAATGGRK